MKSNKEENAKKKLPSNVMIACTWIMKIIYLKVKTGSGAKYFDRFCVRAPSFVIYAFIINIFTTLRC